MLKRIIVKASISYFFLFSFLFFQNLFCQEKGLSFVMPVSCKTYITGSFAELRSNHFHSGIDFSVGGKEGLPIYAVEDGYVSRIKISPFGYGKAIYVSHPQLGLLTVYGHLSRFAEPIRTKVMEEQQFQERYDVEFFPLPGEIPVKKGQIIGFSGNTGTSTAPHLHFEIRNAYTERPINPEILAFNIPDTVPPVFKSLWVFPLDSPCKGCMPAWPKSISIKKNKNNVFISTDTLRVNGTFGLGVEIHDLTQTPGVENGIYSLQLLKDSIPVFCLALDSFSFDESQWINAFIHYPLWLSSGKRVIVTQSPALQPLKLYDLRNEKGRFRLAHNQMVTFCFSASDVKGNNSTLIFSLKGDTSIAIPKQSFPGKWVVSPFQDFRYFEEDIYINIPSRAIASDMQWKLERRKPNNSNLSTQFIVGNEQFPLFRSIEVSIRPLQKIPDELIRKVVFYRQDEKGSTSVQTCRSDTGWFKADISRFGSYSLRLDTTAPIIKPLNFYTGKKVKAGFLPVLEVGDNLSGIATYRITLNGEWVFASWDPKSRKISVEERMKFQSGKNILVVEISDKAGNVNRKTYSLIF